MIRLDLRQTLLLPALLFLTAISSSCEQPKQSLTNASVSVRDSLGILIVENQVPTSGPFLLSENPLFEIGADRPVEESPLDPTAVFSGADGRIIVGDGNQVGWDAVLIYDANGTLIRKVGGPGEGPGEFGGQLWGARPYRGDSILAEDRRGPSVKVFGPDGGYSREVQIPRIPRERPDGTTGYSYFFHGSFRDGSFLASPGGAFEIPPDPGPGWFRHLLLLVHPDGESWDTLGDYRFAQSHWDGRQQNNYLFGSWIFSIPYGDEILLGNSSTYEYQVLNRDGDPRLIVRKMVPLEQVTDEDVEVVADMFAEVASHRPGSTEGDLAQIRRMVEGLPRAEKKPAYSSILVDGERNIWIERFRWLDPWSIPFHPSPTTWDIFAPNGEWRSELVVPAGVLLLSISDDRAFCVRIDEMDVRHVIVYELTRS